MIVFIKIIFESMRQAYHSLVSHKLRTFLSLLGITIGIFTIVAIKTAVDSLKDNVVAGISELGTEVLYVTKFPWTSTTEDNYWKFLKRPDTSFDDYKAVRDKSELAEAASFFISMNSGDINHRSNASNGGELFAATHEYQSIQKLDFAKGRYFTQSESAAGSDKIILGHILAKEIFGKKEPIGKEVKMKGRKYKVVGILKEEGESMFNVLNFDEVAWIPLNTARKFINLKDRNMGKELVIKGYLGGDISELKGEITGILRSSRKQSPREKNNFSLMEPSTINQAMEGFFSVLNITGFIIGIFALIVGMISVANIMFVSVKERTSQIGVKMAIGAKKHMILIEFLIEGLILCLIGGFMGLIMVYGIVLLISNISTFAMNLSFSNMLYGTLLSAAVGVIAAILPAIQASKLDPVVAIRK